MHSSYNVSFLSLCALHVSDSSPSSGATFWSCSHTTVRRMVPAYANCDIQLQNVANDDGLQSETCRALNVK